MASLIAAMTLAFVLAAPALAAPTFPALTGRVVDQANIIPTATRTEIEGKLAALEQKTTDQLVVVTLSSLQGYEIADYGYQLGRAWGIGQKDKNNGVVLIVAPNEHDVRIEVGYGLEGDLTDAVTKLIIGQAILPRFRAGDFPGGISAGIDDVIKVLTGDAATFKERAASEQKDFSSQRSDGQGGGWWTIIVFAVIFIVLSRFGGWWWPLLFVGGGRGGWSSGGGSFGGGGGGFSGGGGSFGGGGSSGHW